MALNKEAVPEPQPNPGAIDLDALVARLTTEFNKGLNALDKKITAVSKAFEKKPEPDPNNPDPNNPPEPKPNPDIKDPAVNAELLELRKQVAKLTGQVTVTTQERDQEKQARLESERTGAIRSALGDVPFRTTERGESLADAAFKLMNQDVKREEDGTYTVTNPDGTKLLLKDYVKSTFLDGDYSFMVQPKGGGGAGARPGQAPAAGGRRWTKADLEPAAMAKLTQEQITDLGRAAVAGEIPMS